MSRLIHCKKLNKQAEGLAEPPYPGELGQRLYNEISQEAWDQWEQLKIMLINENRLNLSDKQDRKFLREKMLAFLFEGDDSKPEGYTEQ